jgi:hypothetical protein
VVLKKNILFWIVMPFSSRTTQCFGAIYTLQIQGLKRKISNKLGDKTGKLISACILFLVVSFLAYSLILKMKVIWFSETSGCLRNTTAYNPKDILFHSYCREKLISNMVLVFTIISLLLLMQDPLVCTMHCDFLGPFQEQAHLGNQGVKQIKLKVACLLLYGSF